MKPHFKPLATALAATLQIAAIAAVPLAWDVRPGQPAPVTFDRYHGETLEFSATFRGFGALPFAQDADIRLWYQTNGMGAAWWSAPATIQSNVLSAVWSPELDPGTDRVSLFFGAPSNAYAAAVLRLRHSPGFRPGAMPDPESFRETDPVFSAWLAGYTPPDTSLAPATNYTDAAARAATNYTDAVAAGLAPTNHSHAQITDGTNTITAAREVYGQVATGGFTDWTPTVREVVQGEYVYKAVDYAPPKYFGTVEELFEDEYYRTYSDWSGPGWYYVYEIDQNGEYFTTAGDYRSGSSNALELASSYFGYVRGYEYETAYKGRLAMTSDLPDTAAIEREVEDLRTESSLVYRLYSGSNVVAEVTNYNSAVHAPELRLMQLNESNEYITVWTETNGLSRTLASARQYTDVATGDVVKAVAPRAWSKVTAGLGAEAPPNTTWISTPTTVFAGGLEYAKVVDTYGEVWVLSGNGMMEFDHDTNSYFRISADDGTPVFSIEKTDAMTVGADADGIEVGASTVTIPVGVVAAEHPTMYWRHALDSGEWADENSPPTGATVAWSGTSGTWVCTVTWSGTRPSSMFFRFTFLQEGGVVIRNNATTDLSSGIVINGTNFVPRVTGGTLTWEVVQ